MRVYFRFLSTQYAAMPMMAATATAAMMATSVVIRGVGSSGVDSSGSIGPAGDGASDTNIAVSDCEGQ